MRIASALSSEAAPGTALERVIADLSEGLGGAQPDLLACFVAPELAARAGDVSERLRAAFPRAALVGCTGQSVIGAGRECEDAPALALLGAQLPGVTAAAFHLAPEFVPAPSAPADTWARALGADPREAPQILLLADPWSCDVASLLVSLDAALPASLKVGGLASGGAGPGASVLFAGDAVCRDGAVGVALTGALRIDSVVAQGCRPIGEPMFVTRCSGQELLEVDGRRPLDVLNELFEAADARERELFRHSLFIGLEMQGPRESYGRGDFLVRNLAGADSETGALQVAALLRHRQVVQFHLRDAASAHDDLAQQLARRGAAPDARGALLFSCLGRGRALYGEPDHDTRAFRSRVADVPIAGFFCNGEIGPVEGRTFLHGYTSAFAIFRERG